MKNKKYVSRGNFSSTELRELVSEDTSRSKQLPLMKKVGSRVQQKEKGELRQIESYGLKGHISSNVRDDAKMVGKGKKEFLSDVVDLDKRLEECRGRSEFYYDGREDKGGESLRLEKKMTEEEILENVVKVTQELCEEELEVQVRVLGRSEDNQGLIVQFGPVFGLLPKAYCTLKNSKDKILFMQNRVGKKLCVQITQGRRENKGMVVSHLHVPINYQDSSVLREQKELYSGGDLDLSVVKKEEREKNLREDSKLEEEEDKNR